MTKESNKLEKLDGKSIDVVEHNIEQLKELFPEVFAEGKISFDKLQELLGNYVAEDEDHYNFTWHGKRQAGRLAQMPSTGTLRPAKDESVDWDATQNLFIEGDNLEVLKLLQKSYHRKVKMIYIDPPYNTGNDFVYEDDFKDGVKNYLETTGQIDSEGKKKGTNSSSAGRYHTNWLNMMYPRLKLARNLLQDDGVIFISIDDNEQDNLKKLCNEVFGEENFIVSLIWKSRQIVDSRNKNNASADHEYILAYSKNPEKGVLRGKNIDLSKYTNPDSDVRGPWMSNSILGLANASQRPNLHYAITNPLTGISYNCPSDSGWRYSRDTMAAKIQQERIVFPKKEDGRPREKKFLAELGGHYTGYSSILPDSIGYTLNGSREVRDLMGGKLFDFPKPVLLLQELVTQSTENDGIILDFFAGSATTAHAVLKLNSQDSNNRKFICVQLPEKLEEKSEAYKAGYKNIADISKERIRRAAKKIRGENPLFAGDLGFKVFKLDTSNIKTWEAGFDTLEEDLLNAVDYIKHDRSSDDVLYELLLKYGLDLTVPIETRTIAGKTVYSIGLGALVVCLDKDVSIDVVNGIGALKEELKPEIMRVVFKDESFKDDVVKTNALQTLKRFGIEDIKSL